MTADDWLADTKVSYDTVAASDAAQVREALDRKLYLRSALALLVDLTLLGPNDPLPSALLFARRQS